MLILKVMMKNLYCYFYTKSQFSFILELQGCRDEVYVWVGDGGERGLNKWNQGKIIEPS